MIAGGQLVKHPDWKQLLTIRYKRTGTGKIQIMSKDEMMRRGWESPDLADALSLTFYGDNSRGTGRTEKQLSDKEVKELSSVYD